MNKWNKRLINEIKLNEDRYLKFIRSILLKMDLTAS